MPRLRFPNFHVGVCKKDLKHYILQQASLTHIILLYTEMNALKIDKQPQCRGFTMLIVSLFTFAFTFTSGQNELFIRLH